MSDAFVTDILTIQKTMCVPSNGGRSSNKPILKLVRIYHRGPVSS